MTFVFLLTMLPATMWNWSVSREFIPFSYNVGLNLYVGNNPDADGGYVDVTGASRLGAVEASRLDGGGEMDGRDYLHKVRGLTLSPGQSSAYWASQAIAFVRENPGTAAVLAGTKLLLSFNHQETPQIENVNLFRKLAGPLGLPVAGTFLVLGFLGLVGLAHARRWGATGCALQLYVVLLAVSTMPFFVTTATACISYPRWRCLPPLRSNPAPALEDPPPAEPAESGAFGRRGIVGGRAACVRQRSRLR